MRQVPRRTRRLLEIVAMIGQSQRWTATALAGHFGLSRAQIHEDLRVLREAGLRIERGRSGYTLPASSACHLSEFSLDEITALLLPAELFARGSDNDLEGRARSKLLKGLPPEARTHLTRLLRRTLVDTESSTVRDRRFELLGQAVCRELAVRIHYRALRATRSLWQEVHPYGLLYKQHSWFLVGLCPASGRLRRFRLDRIRKVELSGKAFKYPREFGLAKYMKGPWSLFDGDGRRYEVAVKLSARIAPIVKEELRGTRHHLLPFSDGTLMLRTVVRGVDELAWWLIKFGKEAVVLTPPALREKLCRIARGVLRANSKPLPPEHEHVGNSQ